MTFAGRSRRSDRSSAPDGPGPLAETVVTVHALGWLVAGNAVGLLLATLLLAPAAGSVLGPLTYGRWMPVHWNAQLYGWLALPLVGLLLRIYDPGPDPAGIVARSGSGSATPSRPALATVRSLERWAVAAWTATLAVGCVSWLAGLTSGKPFLEWSGAARWLLVADLAFLEAVLATALVRGLRDGTWSRWGGRGRSAFLVALASVPVAMAVATSPRVYPPINPDSGGPTGTSLLGSTLGIVWLFILFPLVLRLPARAPERRQANRTVAALTIALAGLHTVAFLALDLFQGGDRSHHDALQVIALLSLLPWPAILWAHLGRFRYPDGAGRWLGAFGAWGSLLVVTAFVSFLPGVLERWKFTNALVAHAHLAMAGMMTSFVALVLIALGRGTPLAGVLAAPGPFALWHFGCLIYVVSMLMLGTLEGIDPGIVMRGGPTSTGLYAFRWLAGALMLGASVAWWAGARRRLAEEAV